jgi:hypothetical protein
MDAWVGGVVGIVIGIILTEGLQWLRDWREGKEKYRVMLYEKRLDIHQQAFTLLRKLMAATNASDEGRREIIEKADEWWNSHCLYLDEESRKKLLEAIISVENLVDLPPPRAGFRKSARLALEEASAAVMNGIGMKHLEKPVKMNQESAQE